MGRDRSLHCNGGEFLPKVWHGQQEEKELELKEENKYRFSTP